jgi:hypothetical protein
MTTQFRRIKNRQKGKKFKAYLARCRFLAELGFVSRYSYDFSNLSHCEIGRVDRCRSV